MIKAESVVKRKKNPQRVMKLELSITELSVWWQLEGQQPSLWWQLDVCKPPTHIVYYSSESTSALRSASDLQINAPEQVFTNTPRTLWSPPITRHPGGRPRSDIYSPICWRWNTVHSFISRFRWQVQKINSEGKNAIILPAKISELSVSSFSNHKSNQFPINVHNIPWQKVNS